MRILQTLQVNGRISNLKLAESVGLSPDATRDRVQRLVRENYILGYEAVLSPAMLHAGLLVYTEVRLEHAGLHTADEFKAAVRQRPEILECHEVAGNFDYLIKTRVPDMETYRSCIAAVIWNLPGVRDTRTYAVMEELKNTARIPL
jgi:Lrp/AsnC family leucine-responsive transcriptional regulator